MTNHQHEKEVQISFRTSSEVKRLVRIEAAKQDMSLNEWIKQLVQKKIEELKLK